MYLQIPQGRKPFVLELSRAKLATFYFLRVEKGGIDPLICSCLWEKWLVLMKLGEVSQCLEALAEGDKQVPAVFLM